MRGVGVCFRVSVRNSTSSTKQAALGPAVSLIIITQVGCDSVSIIILFTITLLFNGSYFGGSMLGVMDLGVNFAGTMSGISGTITGITGIIAPTIVGAVTNNQQTISAWTTVFYISSAMSALPYLSYIFFGSVQEQPWNKIKVERSNSDLNDEIMVVDNHPNNNIL
uniref:Major facilitator superfamily (MFS) profile domain-containing protein n=1 Tax=Timema cristinae TaxID=61476 RepID=A0A7R9D696_TIMCR|nr:unnamed protein product [Timema cristinae]